MMSKNWLNGPISGNLGSTRKKCKVMTFGKPLFGKTNIVMRSNSGDLVRFEEAIVERDLGIMIDNRLNW